MDKFGKRKYSLSASVCNSLVETQHILISFILQDEMSAKLVDIV